MVVTLFTEKEHQLARALVESHGLRFEQNFDVLLGIFDGNDLIATGARDRNVFKMLCIRSDFQSGSVLGELLTELLNSGAYSGYQSFFIFTRPEHSRSFQQFNFTPLVNHHKVCLLESGNGLKKYLQRHQELVKPGNNGAVVVNCNPFTLGHRYLIEAAAAQVDQLYVFVVREDRSIFPFEVRYRLVREGTADLPNVTILDTSDYAVSNVTFPSYFLKADDDLQSMQMEIDLVLFGKHIAPFFHINKRFIGTEPYCRTTRIYSDTMHRVLASFNIETVQLERKTSKEQAISAFRVREALKKEAFETLTNLVPETTLNFLRSEEGRALRAKLLDYQRRH
ncbi:MAG: [citrate (pro-3S)-lyase] ligase [Desulfuromonadaceae bacterium]